MMPGCWRRARLLRPGWWRWEEITMHPIRVWRHRWAWQWHLWLIRAQDGRWTGNWHVRVGPFCLCNDTEKPWREAASGETDEAIMERWWGS